MFDQVRPGLEMGTWELITPAGLADDVFGVSAQRLENGEWEVWVSACEFVRFEPLQTELQDGITAALEAVAGVTQVLNEDREIWLVNDAASGPNLVLAAASVVARLKDRIDEALDDV